MKVRYERRLYVCQSSCDESKISIPTIVYLLYICGSVVVAKEMAEANPKNMQQVERGKMIYKKFCAFCHGEKLEGQANWRKRRPDGKLPAPPHDETGHTWHHPDDVLFGITKNGLVPPHAPANYKSDIACLGQYFK